MCVSVFQIVTHHNVCIKREEFVGAATHFPDKYIPVQLPGISNIINTTCYCYFIFFYELCIQNTRYIPVPVSCCISMEDFIINQPTGTSAGRYMGGEEC